MTRNAKSVIESIGVYLPPDQLSTKEIMAGCANPVRVPLERLTGIRSRHVTRGKEFSIDLATRAIEDCLSRSRCAPGDFDLLICANISRFDAPGRVSYEPSTAATLKNRFGFDKALAFDVSNACAGMWTAVYLVDALLRAGSIRRGMVVSGEYISYLSDNAQKEIVDYLDPQIASLTVGDSGVAVSLELSLRPDVGFHDVELYTLAKYSRHCIAKPTQRSYAGIAMHTDAIKATSAVAPQAAMHAMQVLLRNDRSLRHVKHIIPHQTSRLTMQDALKEIARQYQIDLSEQLVNNLAERGNTATTTHFLALRDLILANRIRSGDEILFLISGSGQTSGTALYTCDDLPDRLPAGGRSAAPDAKSTMSDWGQTLPVTLAVEALALARPEGEPPDSLRMLEAASRRCLEKSRYARDEVQLLLSVGLYRNEFVTEPAIAALLADQLGMNDGREPSNERRTLAFELLNGSMGFLNACYVASELARTGAVERSMIVASEIENNREVTPDALLGLDELATATILHESPDGETGFQAFAFDHYPKHTDALRAWLVWNQQGRPYMLRERADNLLDLYLECIETSVTAFLRQQGRSREELKVLLPPQISADFVSRVGERLGFPAPQVVDATTDGKDVATSSTPLAMLAVAERGLVQVGDLGLIVNVGAGIQVACALYRF